jgi:peptidoglycan/xylan/chitin deacetylase (PgdA/CDA1 family)
MRHGWRLVAAWLFGLMALLTSVGAVAQNNSNATVFLYGSPITQAFFTQNGADYGALKDRWKEYCRQTGVAFKEVSRANLLEGLKPGTLVLASAVLLDEAERKAIQAYADSGQSVIASWGTGARDGKGHWAGYGFIEKLFNVKVVQKPPSEEQELFVNTFGDGPLTWAIPGGTRIFLGEIAEVPVRVQSKQLAGRYFNWLRFPAPNDANGAVAYFEQGNSRRVYLGFAESSWEYDGNAQVGRLLDGVFSWVQHAPVVVKAAWPNGLTSAQLLEMDTEDKYENALNFAAELDKANIKGTFYSLTSVALKFRPVVMQLMNRHEIGYHGEVHFGFKGKTPEVQADRLQTMQSQMRDIVGSQRLPLIKGFRAPTESWDPTTEQLLRRMGVSHHVLDPASTEARLPFFSTSEPDLATEQAIVDLPRTQMDDLNYLGLKLDVAKASELIMRDFDYLHEQGGLGVLSVHSQNYGPKGLMTFLTPPYVKRLQEYRKEVWAASGGEIEDWWRARARVKFIAGRLLGDRFNFTVMPPAGVKGLTFIIFHPLEGRGPKEVVPETAGAPRPIITALDAFRSAVVFADALPAGHYVYRVGF